MSQPEITLWRAVILQQFIDATSRPRTINKTSLRRQKHQRANARIWLTRNSDGFRIICDLAELPIADVRREVDVLVAAGWPYKKFNIHNGPKGTFA